MVPCIKISVEQVIGEQQRVVIDENLQSRGRERAIQAVRKAERIDRKASESTENSKNESARAVAVELLENRHEQQALQVHGVHADAPIQRELLAVLRQAIEQFGLGNGNLQCVRRAQRVSVARMIQLQHEHIRGEREGDVLIERRIGVE